MNKHLNFLLSKARELCPDLTIEAYQHDWDNDPFDHGQLAMVELNPGNVVATRYRVVSRDAIVFPTLPKPNHFHCHVDYNVTPNALATTATELITYLKRIKR